MNYQDGDYLIEPKTGSFAKELQGLGNDITFFGQILPATKNNIHVFGIQKHGLKALGSKRKRNKILSYLILYIKAISPIIKNDFIYFFYPTAFKYLAILCRILGKKYGLYIRGMQGINDRISHHIYKNAYTIATVSDYFTQQVNMIIDRKIAYTIRPMITLTEKDIITNRKYICKEKYKLLYLGRTTNDKGIIELLRAISILKETDHNFFLKIVGNGEYIDDLKSLSNHLNLNNLVSFEGPVYDPTMVRKYYVDADIYILPTYHEGFPRTLYEAMIYGTPIITTFVGGIPILMRDNFNCKRIEQKSINSIVEVLSWAMNNYENLGAYAQNATKTVSKIVDPKQLTHAQQLNQILKQ